MNAERIQLMQWNSTRTPRTFFTCGKRRCFRILKTRGKKGEGKEWENNSLISFKLMYLLMECVFIRCLSIHPPQEQKRCVDSSTLQREVKKVRKARNRKQEWKMMAFDKELRPDHHHPQTLRRGASSEGSLSPDGRLMLHCSFHKRYRCRKFGISNDYVAFRVKCSGRTQVFVCFCFAVSHVVAFRPVI